MTCPPPKVWARVEVRTRRQTFYVTGKVYGVRNGIAEIGNMFIHVNKIVNWRPVAPLR